MNGLTTAIWIVVCGIVGGVIGYVLRDSFLPGLLAGAVIGLGLSYVVASIGPQHRLPRVSQAQPNFDQLRRQVRITIHDLPEEFREVVEMIGVLDDNAESNIELLQSIAEDFPGCVDVRLNLGFWQLEVGNVDAAEQTYQSVIADFPDEKGATAGLARVYLVRNQFARAEELAREAIASGYRWANCHSTIAKCREAAGDVDAAIEAYLQAYRMAPHGWENLKSYCRLKKRPYRSPLEEGPRLIDDHQLRDLYAYIDEAASDAESGGCDHTLRFTTQWAVENNMDVIELYQFVNANGGFCDCEVCLNVETLETDE